MSLDLRKRLFVELDRLVLIDPHTHINALDPASHTLADILGYHYYTELAHSAGMPKDQIEEPGLDPKEKVARLIENLGPVQNTIQYSWLVEMCQTFFGLHDDYIGPNNWEKVYDGAEMLMSHGTWPEEVLRRSRIEAVFLTNDFDDPLEGFDTRVYIPCLRTDDLVFHLAKPEVRQRLEKTSGYAPSDARSLRRGIAALFTHFKLRGARACAISLPPDFAPMKVSLARANTALAAIHADGTGAAESHRRAIANFVFWTLAEMCDLFKLPFDLMIGVNRGVYEAGVYQGRDLYDSRVSLIQYKELFNAFRRVTFPISVLASVTNQELASYAWIFPNVTTNGHWWYSNTPAFIEHDLAARLEAVPRTKQVAYYSDMYKLEFALPKFAMFKRILAKVLAERFVIDRGWSEDQAISLGKQVLRGNVETIFRWNEDLRNEMPGLNLLEPVTATSPLGPIPAAVTLEAQARTTPLPFESESRERLPERPVKEFVIPVPTDREDPGLRLAGEPAAASTRQPPELEVIQEPSAASEIPPDSLPPVAVEPVEEVGEVSETLRRTEPFPSNPPTKEPGQIRWDLLGEKE
jgi:glucuronate isomerase